MSYKQQAAVYTVDHFIASGMVVGLGVGTTVHFAIQHLAKRLQEGVLSNIVGIPAGEGTHAQAEALGIPLTTLDEHPKIDVTFDGADEVDPNLNLIKGGGGALLREKILASASAQEIIMVDESKLVPVLGTNWALPIEVIPFGLGAHRAFLESLGGAPELRKKPDGSPFHTDSGHYILDTAFGPIHNPLDLAQQLNAQPGIVEHGLFMGLATQVVVAGKDGIRTLKPT